MKTVTEISGVLRNATRHQAIRQADLKSRAGISQRTLTKVLGGQDDYKLSTLLALADRLGLELLLVPKGAAQAVDAGRTSEPQIKSRVAAALDRVRGGEGA